MGIILAALSGAGKAAGEIADSNIKLWNQKDLETQRADLEQKKAMELAAGLKFQTPEPSAA